TYPQRCFWSQPRWHGRFTKVYIFRRNTESGSGPEPLTFSHPASHLIIGDPEIFMHDLAEIQQMTRRGKKTSNVPIPWRRRLRYNMEISWRVNELDHGAEPPEHADRPWHVHSRSHQKYVLETSLLEQRIEIPGVLM